MECYKKMTIILIPVLYAVAMLQFYNVDYFVPDYHLYYEFGKQHLWAKDGFSTLFLLISGLVNISPTKIHLVPLLLMTFSLGCFIYFLSVIVKQSKFFIVGLVGIVSVGVWYYIYGKLFYDIPFTLAFYGISLILVAEMYRKEYQLPNIIMKRFSILLIVMGLCLSWKPYNIFAVAGLASFFMCVPVLKKQLDSICCVRNILRLCFFFLLGWIIGNYGILFNMFTTLKGLAAYPAQCDLQYFFFLKGRLIWDHINDLSFNESNVHLLTLLFVLIVMPLSLKKWILLKFAFFFLCMFCVFIKFFSLGYPWHGFMFSVYVITFYIFILGEWERNRSERNSFYIRFALLTLAIGVQVITTFTLYIPKQVCWFNDTQIICNKLQAHKEDILQVTDKALKNEEGTYDIHCDLKRYKFLDGKDRIPVYVDKNNIKKWDEIFENERFVSDKSPDFIVRIYVDDEERLFDVMPPKIYKGFIKKEVFSEDGVRMAIYRRVEGNDLNLNYGGGDYWHRYKIF